MASTERRQRRIDEHRPLTAGGAIVPSGTTAAPPAGPGIGVPGAPQNVRILETFLLHGQGLGLAGANVVWALPFGASPDRYLVQWDVVSSFIAPAGRVAFQPSIALDGMPTGTTIYVRVAALVGGVQGAWSATVSAVTPSDTTVPAAPTNLVTAWSGQTGDLAISWTASPSNNVKDYRVRIYAANGGALLREAFTPAVFYGWTKGLHFADTGGAYDPSVYLVITARSWSGILSTDLTGTATLAAPATPAGLTTSWAGDTGTAGPNCLITWALSAAVAGYRLTIDGTARDVGLTARYDYGFAQNQAEHAGTADPALSLTLVAVDALGQTSPAASVTATNAAPPATTMTAFAAFDRAGLTITPSAALDFKDYRVRVYRDAALVDTFFTVDAKVLYQVVNGTGSYQFDVAVRDLFGQIGAASALTTAAILEDVAAFVASLRAGAIYSDQLATNPETLFDAYTDDNRASGGVSYAANATWVRWIRFERPERERYRTITLSMTPTSGTTTWYIRTSEDATTWNYYAGPVTSGRILTSVASAAAAQSAAVSAATLGGPSTSRVDLPAMVSARYVEVWLRNTTAATRVDEYYPRRLVQSDDLEAEAVKAVHIGASAITAGHIQVGALDGFTITGATIRTAASGPRIEMSGSEIRAIDATPVIRVKINTEGIITYDSFGNVQIEATTATDGALRAGTGVVVLDRNGISVLAKQASTYDSLNAYRFRTTRAGSATREVGMYSYEIPSGNGDIRVSLAARSTDHYDGVVSIRAQGGTRSTIFVAATAGNLAPTVEVFANSSTGERMTHIYGGGVMIGPRDAESPQSGELVVKEKMGVRTDPHTSTAIFVKSLGTTASTYGLSITNSGGAVNTFYVQDNGNAYLQGTLTQASARRTKDAIADIADGLASMRPLRPATYTRGGRDESGLVADEVQSIPALAHLVSAAADGTLSLNYIGLLPYALRAIQQLDARLDILERRR